jgi:DNA-binding CsgD family transcriptional regulator
MTDRFVRAVEAIYISAADPSHWPTALQIIADCFEDVGAILIYGRDDGSFGVIESPALTAVCEEYRQGWSDKDTRAIRGRERGYWKNNDTITDRDVVTPEEIATDPFYADLLTRHGLRHFAASMASPDPRIEVGVSVQRAIGKPEYSDEEVALLDRLGPHIERSLRLSIRLMDAELSKLGLADALSRVGIGVFVLDSIGRVVFSNEAARASLGEGLEMVDDRLVAAQTAQPQHGSVQRQVVDYDPAVLLEKPRPILIHRRGEQRPLTLYVLPIPAASKAVNAFLTHARAIVLVIDPKGGDPADPSLIRDVLGVTLGEAKIASLVAAGVAPRDAAEKLGISEETARTVLKRVFAKVGVSRQSELAALLTRLVLR